MASGASSPLSCVCKTFSFCARLRPRVEPPLEAVPMHIYLSFSS
jgi:hypothetical protein